MSKEITSEYCPLVSIAIATYNGEAFLKEQIDSLLNQTYQNFEIIISDDGSIDNTQNILQYYSEIDKRVRWSKNDKNVGFIANFGEAIKKCKGEIIFLCDQDDFWYPEKISKHVAVYSDPKISWAYNELAITDAARKIIGYLNDSMPDYWTRRNLLYYTWGSCVLGCATSYRRKFVSNIWPADKNAPGHDSWIQLAIYPEKAAYIKEVLQDYRQHSTNVVGLREVHQSQRHDLERQAIDNNIKYIAGLISNNKIQFWKRTFFFFIYIGKLLRASVFCLL